ncbi:MAG: protein-glutamate O-methyltransferase CheR [Dissulfuribacterales bacterium]
MEPDRINHLKHLVEQRTGCRFSSYNPGTFQRRLLRRMSALGIHDIDAYEAYLQKNPSEYQTLLHSLTIKVSEFFRDTEIFNHIEQHIIPEIFERHAQQNDRNIRIWSTACAYGEEVYSTAILLFEYLQRMEEQERKKWNITLLGTDIDQMAVEKAREAVYNIKSMEDVISAHPNAFQRIIGMPEHIQVIPEIQAMAQFVCFDITTVKYLAPPVGIFTEYDIIYCRNVLIYYDYQQKFDTLHRLYECLNPDGYLVLGKAESMPDELLKCLVPVKHGIKIYKKGLAAHG